MNGGAKLTVGTISLPASSEDAGSCTVELPDGRTERYELAELTLPRLGQVRHFAEQIDEVVVGFAGIPDVGFLRFLPNARDVWILDSCVKDLSGLLHLKKLQDLGIDRPTCRMDLLGELKSLRKLYLDDWRPGAESIFRLSGLEILWLQKYRFPDLTRLAQMGRLMDLWLNAGRLDELTGIPPTLKNLRLTSQRKLASLKPVKACSRLEDLRMQTCTQVKSLEGLEGCRELRILSLAKVGPVPDLSPLSGLKRLDYLVLADGTVTADTNLDALYTLPALKVLIIPRKSGVDPDRVRSVAPACDVRLASE